MTLNLQQLIDIARIKGKSLSLEPGTHHVEGRINMRDMHGISIGGSSFVELIFHVDDDDRAPLIDCTDSERINLYRLKISMADGKSSCATLWARFHPGMNSRWNIMEQVHIEGGNFSVATVMVMGAEHTRHLDCFFANNKMPALYLASTNVVKDRETGDVTPLIVSPFGDVAGDRFSGIDFPSVSQSRYSASNCGFTARGAPAAVRVDRGVTGFYFDGNCNASAWGCDAAYEINSWGGTAVTQGEIKGGIDGNPKYSVLLKRLTHDVEFRLHTDIPWAQTHEDHADEFTRKSLNAMTEYAGVVEE